MCEAGGIVLRLPHHPLMGLTAIFGAITPMILLGTSTFLSLRWLWFILLYEASECVKRDVWEGKGEGRIMCEPSEYIKEKSWLYWTTHLSVSTSVPLTVNPGSIALRRPTGPLPFFLPGLFPFFTVSCSGSLSSCLLRCLKLIDST